MKKQRGLKKYYKRLKTENDLEKATWLVLDDPKAWFDNWHLHFDWKGFGNNSFKRRKPHLDKLFRHFDLLEEETKKLEKDFQLYAVVLDYDSASDALFLHTPNPNKENFPFKYDSLKKKSTLTNQDLNHYLSEIDKYEKFYGTAEESFCVLFKKNIGIEPK
ncbi:hypothetical protein [Peijinzhouia sedimentorum]